MDFLCGTSESGWATTEAYAANVTDSSKCWFPLYTGITDLRSEH